VQDADLLFECPPLPSKCRTEDFMTTNISNKAIQTTAYWEGNGIRKPIRQEKYLIKNATRVFSK